LEIRGGAALCPGLGGVFGEELVEEGLALGVGERGRIRVGGWGGGGTEEGVEDAGDGRGAGGGKPGGVDEGDEGAGGAEGGWGVKKELIAEGADGVGHTEAEGAGDVGPDFVLSAVQFGHEGGMAVSPVVEGFAVDAEGGADVPLVVTDEEVIDGGELLGGEGVSLGSF